MEKIFSSFDRTQLYLNKQIPDNCKAVVVIVHGLCEHQGRYDYFTDRLHQKGLATYRFDHRGHGRSEGESTYYEDFNEILEDTNVVVEMAIQENPNKPVFLLGHSMGGYTVSLYGAKYPTLPLRGIVTSGALTKDNGRLILDVPKALDPHTKFPNELGAGVCSVAEVVASYEEDPYNTKTFTAGLCYSICDGIQWFEERMKTFAYPVLMLHGEKDGLVSVQDTYDFFAAAASTDKQMKIYGNLFHEIYNEYCKDEVISDTIQWILHRI